MSASAQSSGVDLGSGREFDAIVLGAGPVGQNVAARTRAAGLSVAVVERELVTNAERFA
jgi:2-polyprenyl-6-methoxyphenol hydroxylase-like FAD-dependent oxidoreductase